MAVNIGVSLRGRSRNGSIYLSVLGLVNGQAQIGQQHLIQALMSNGAPILSLSWGGAPDGDDYGTGPSPEAFASGLGGTLYLTVTTSFGTFRESFPIVSAAHTSNVPEVMQITINDNGDGSSDVVLLGQEPFAGTYQIETALLESGKPVLVRGAEWTSTGMNAPYDLTPPLWLVPSDDPAVFNQDVVDFDGTEIAFSDPFLSTDPSGGYIFTYSAENFAGAVDAAPVFIQRPSQTVLSFNDSHFGFIDGGSASGKFSVAFRMQLDLSTLSPFEYVMLGSALRAVHDGSVFSISVRNIMRGGTQTFPLGSNGVLTFSVMMTADLEGSARLDVHTGSTWTTLLNSTDIDPTKTFIGQAMNLGAQSSGSAGPAFTLFHQFWQHNDVPADFNALRDEIFAADGEVKDLLPDGAAAGLSPIFYFKGQDFATGHNSGSSPDASLSRTAIIVTEI